MANVTLRGAPFRLQRSDPTQGEQVNIAYRKTQRSSAPPTQLVEDWAGEVLEIDIEQRSFHAKLVDQMILAEGERRKSDRHVKLNLDQVPPAFRNGFRRGQQFRWQVLAIDIDDSRRDWTTSIVFTPRREITRDDMDFARDQTTDILNVLDAADRRAEP